MKKKKKEKKKKQRTQTNTSPVCMYVCTYVRMYVGAERTVVPLERSATSYTKDGHKRESTFFPTCDPRRHSSVQCHAGREKLVGWYVPTSACCTENSNIVGWKSR